MFTLANILQPAVVGEGGRVDDPLSCIFAILAMMLGENWLNSFCTKRVKFFAIFSNPTDHTTSSPGLLSCPPFYACSAGSKI